MPGAGTMTQDSLPLDWDRRYIAEHGAALALLHAVLDRAACCSSSSRSPASCFGARCGARRDRRRSCADLVGDDRARRRAEPAARASSKPRARGSLGNRRRRSPPAAARRTRSSASCRTPRSHLAAPARAQPLAARGSLRARRLSRRPDGARRRRPTIVSLSRARQRHLGTLAAMIVGRQGRRIVEVPELRGRASRIRDRRPSRGLQGAYRLRPHWLDVWTRRRVDAMLSTVGKLSDRRCTRRGSATRRASTPPARSVVVARLGLLLDADLPARRRLRCRLRRIARAAFPDRRCARTRHAARRGARHRSSFAKARGARGPAHPGADARGRRDRRPVRRRAQRAEDQSAAVRQRRRHRDSRRRVRRRPGATG